MKEKWTLTTKENLIIIIYYICFLGFMSWVIYTVFSLGRNETAIALIVMLILFVVTYHLLKNKLQNRA